MTSVFPPAEPKTERDDERDGREVNIRDLKRKLNMANVVDR